MDSLKSYFKYSSIITFFLISLNVFFFDSQTINSLEIKEYYASLIAIIYLLLCCAYLILSSKYSKISITNVDILVLCLFLYVFINSIINDQLNNIVIITKLLALITILIFKKTINFNFNLNLLTLIIIVIGSIEAIYGGLQLYGICPSLNTKFKLTGTFLNPGIFGIYVACTFIFSVGQYLFSSNIYVRNVAFISILICFLTLPASQSRAAWIASLVGCFYLINNKYKYFQFYQFRRKPSLLLLSILCVALVSYLLFVYKENSALGRLLIWQNTISLIFDHPIFGVGLGNFKNQYGFYQAKYFQENSNIETFSMLADKVEYAFNDYLQLLAEFGILGFIIFSVLLVSLFIKFDIDKNRNLAPFKATVISLLIASLFSYPLQSFSFFWLLLCLLIVIDSASPVLYSLSIKLNIVYKALIIPIMFFLIWTINLSLNDYLSKKQWFIANQLLYQGDKAEALIKYEELIENYQNNELMAYYGLSLYLNKEFESANSVFINASKNIADPTLYANLGNSYSSLGKFRLAENAYKQSIYMVPNRLYPRYLLANLYLLEGDSVRAINTAKDLLKIPVKVKSDATDAILKDMNKLIDHK